MYGTASIARDPHACEPTLRPSTHEASAPAARQNRSTIVEESESPAGGRKFLFEVSSLTTAARGRGPSTAVAPRLTVCV